MKNKLRNKRIAVYIALFILLLGGSFVIYQVIKADNNTARFKTISISSIDTGGDYNASDGHNYIDQAEYSSKEIVPGYEGRDSSSMNSIVRTFDRVSYHLSYTLEDPNGNEYYDSSALTVRVRTIFDETISDVVTVSGDNCSKDGENIYTCLFTGKELLDNSSSYEDEINVVVLNAENGTYIDPRFEISIDNSTSEELALGHTGDGETSHTYEYTDGVYGYLMNSQNTMPTVVTAAQGEYIYNVANPSTTQLASVGGNTGRLITYFLEIKLGNGMVGYHYDLSDINLNVAFSQDNNLIESSSNWIRLYDNQSVDGINPLEEGIPYSNSIVGDYNKYVKYPGNLTVSGDAGSYNLNLSGFKIGFDNPTLAANGNSLDMSSPYVATIALSNFSGRSVADGKNDILNTVTITGSGNASNSMINSYEVSGTDPVGNANNKDYSLSAAFYEENGNPIAIRLGGSGSTSKGTKTLFKTIFNYHKANSDQGLKEVIKFDDAAYRIIPRGIEDQIDIQVLCNESACEGISKDDFEIKYVSGNFDPSNYSLVTDFTDSRLNDVEKDVANSDCPAINLYGLSADQVQNLYGGPCITANAGTEQTFNSIYDASSNDIEVPITKVIVQTKAGVTLPDNSKVIIGVGVKVRNVSDITYNYQATVTTSTSDYDSELIYYIPRGDVYSPKVTDPNNYTKTMYQYRTVINPDEDYIGDDLKIVNFTSRQSISVTNTNSDGTTKVNYRTTDNDTIEYVVSTNINDFSENAGADDVWYIPSMIVYVTIPSELVYIPEDNPYLVSYYTDNIGRTNLIYRLGSVKPNMLIPQIKFKAKLDPKLKGETKTITVTSRCEPRNVNDEIDTSITSATTAEFSIYGTGVSEVIGEMRIGDAGSVVEKDTEFSYILNAYNNTGVDVTDYSFIDVLPYTDKDEANREGRGSKFSGSYEVMISAPGIEASNIKCSKASPNSISKHAKDKDNDDNNIWEDCGSALNEYTSGITAFKVDNIAIASDSYMNDIIVYVRPTGNNYSDKYANNFVGKTKKTSENISNTITISVVNRNISGRVFVDTSGMGVQDESTTYLENIPVTLYKVSSNGSLENKGETSTDKDGNYKFENLEPGRYKIRSNYNTTVYDATLRYATENTAIDSDAYKVNDDGILEISDKSETSKGIVLSREITSQSHMDFGLLPRSTFGFDMKKYITRIDLTNNGVMNTNLYNNESTVNLSVLNPNRFNAKVYYGISLTNNSSIAGIVHLVEEDIPAGMIFDSTLEENKDWFEVNGKLRTNALDNIIIKPGETKYLQIVLYLPERNEAGTFINTASVIEMSQYDPQLAEDITYENTSDYRVGDALSFAGVNWHVIKSANGILTLLADSGTITNSQSHNNGSSYKWSTSNIKTFINNTWITTNNLNPSILIDDPVCDDASTLDNGTYGGTPSSLGTGCVSGSYTLSKVRLLSKAEYENLINSGLSDYSWLNGNKDYWLASSVDGTQVYDDYGNVTNENINTLASYVDYSAGMVKAKANTTSLEVRPVIEIATYNIIPE